MIVHISFLYFCLRYQFIYYIIEAKVRHAINMFNQEKQELKKHYRELQWLRIRTECIRIIISILPILFFNLIVCVSSML